MKLTDCLRQEVLGIVARVSYIKEQLTEQMATTGPSAEQLQDLNDCKLRMENILLETDVKELSKYCIL